MNRELYNQAWKDYDQGIAKLPKERGEARDRQAIVYQTLLTKLKEAVKDGPKKGH